MVTSFCTVMQIINPKVFLDTLFSLSPCVLYTSSGFPEYLLNSLTSSTTTTIIIILVQALSYPDRIFVSYLIHLHSLALIRETKGKLQIWLHLPFGLPATKISIHKTLSGFSSLLGLTALEWLLQLLNMVYNASALVRFRSLANSHTSSLLQAHWPFGPAFLPVSFCYRVFAQVAFLSLEIPSTGNSLFILQLPAFTSSGRCSLISPIRLDLLLALRVPCTVLYITYHKFTLFVWLYDWKLREAWNCVCICSPSYTHCQS